MSSRFISSENAKEITDPSTKMSKEDAWLQAQKEIDAAARKVEETRRMRNNTMSSGRIAKQEAFEEATRLRNQFRALDEDEIQFLDAVLDQTRAEEAKIKAETAQGLLSFRHRQAEVDEKALSDSVPNGLLAEDGVEGIEKSSLWAVSLPGNRKRKRVKGKGASLEFSKIQRISSENKKRLDDPQRSKTEQEGDEVLGEAKNTPKSAKIPKSEKLPSPSPISKSSLVDYGSDLEDW